MNLNELEEEAEPIDIIDGCDYLARITWNDNLWQKPSGSKLEHESSDNFSSKFGYGHEEWLFSNKFIHDGFAYGFIRGAFSKKKDDRGKKFNLILYTVSKSKGWYFVGKIFDCEILTEEMASEAVGVFRANGLMQEMVRDIESVNGNPSIVLSNMNGFRSIFSVRFKPSSLKLFKEPISISQNSEIRTHFKRYQMYEATSVLVKEEFEDLKRSSSIEITSGIRKIEEKEILLNYRQKEMQTELINILSKRFKKVLCEYKFIDIFIEDNTTLIEIKTYESPKQCIREAIGQLFEYAYFSSGFTNPKLVIIGPSKMNSDEYNYLSKLNQLFNINISYCHYEVGTQKFDYIF